MTLSRRQRMITVVVAFGALAVVGATYVIRAAHETSPSASTSEPAAGVVGGSGTAGAPSPPAGATPLGTAASSPASQPPFALGATGGLLFVDDTPGPHYGRVSVVELADPSGRRLQSDVVCARVYAARGRVLCMRQTTNVVPSYEAVIMDDRMRTQKTIEVAGLPSRARISADGNIASWTVFVSGDSYLSVGFSTRTSVLDLRSGELIGSLETFAVSKDSKPYASSDINFWGVTVASDDRTFYATMATKGKTYLVRGDLVAKTVTTIAQNVECPSLSPDGTRLVFKKRVDADGGRRPWRLWVLDLRTMRETALAEERSVDDQAAWLDAATVAYSLPIEGITSYDVWSVRADGTGAPAKVLEHGSSPAPFGAS